MHSRSASGMAFRLVTLIELMSSAVRLGLESTLRPHVRHPNDNKETDSFSYSFVEDILDFLLLLTPRQVVSARDANGPVWVSAQ